MKVNYASNGEDILLYRCFGSQAPGIYVDVGAHHPTYGSATKLFHDLGWHGLNIEPGPTYDILCSQRPQDINLKVVLSDTDQDVDFFVHHGCLATSSAIDSTEGLEQYDLRRERQRIRSYRLDTLANEYPIIRSANFFKIDAEGSENAIVRGANWTTLRPEVMVIEATKPFSNERRDAEKVQVLRKFGFFEVYFDGINAWFVREESSDLQAHFELPINQLDGFRFFDPERERLEKELALFQSTWSARRVKAKLRRVWRFGRSK